MEQQIWSIKWGDELSVGIPEIDLEHQQFVALVNNLNQAIVDRLDLATIRQRLLAIAEDSSSHFAHEEELFAQWNYPDAAQHAEKHREISDKLHALLEKLGNETAMFSWIEAGLTIKQLLMEHLLNEDMRYRDFLRATKQAGISGT